MNTLWPPQKPRRQTRASSRIAGTLLVIVLLLTGLAAPLGGAQEASGGGGGGGAGPATPETSPPPQPDLAVRSLQQVPLGGSCCQPPEPCCEPAPGAEPEPCCPAEEPSQSDCCADPTSLPVGQALAAFELVIENRGMVVADDVQVQVWWAPHGSPRALAPLSELGPGEAESVHFYLEAMEGLHSVHVAVDPEDRIAEWDEDNNLASVEAQFGIEARPDLTVGAATFRSYEWEPRSALIVAFRVLNQGDASAGSFRVMTLYGSVVHDTLLVDGLVAGEALEREVRIGQPLDHGTVMIVVDPLDQVEERHEWNNDWERFHSASTVELAVTDLRVPDLPLSEGPSGPEAEVRFHVTNQGQLDAFDESYRGYEILLQHQVVAHGLLPRLASGESADVVTHIPATPGVHLVEVRINVEGYVQERDHRDNQMAALASFGYPDLAATIDIETPTGGNYGDASSATVTVQNDGRFPTPATSLMVWDGTEQIADHEVAALAPGATWTVVVAWTMSPGVHALVGEVDPTDTLQEGDEANNRVTATVDLGWPDLAVTDLEWDLETPEEGRPLHITTTSRYDGLLGLPATSLVFEIDGAAFATWALADLEPGEDVSVMSEWHPPEGEHQLTARIDPQGDWREHNETNNARAASLYVRAPTPAACTTSSDLQETCRRVLLGEDDPLQQGE